MKKIYLGYSQSKDGDFIASQFDIEGEFLEIITEGYLDDGAFEVYSSDDDISNFEDYETLKSYFPFEIELERLRKINLEVAGSVFYVNYEYEIKKWSTKNLVIIDCFYIARFIYE